MDEIQKVLKRLLGAPPVESIRHKDFTPEIRGADDAKRTIEFVSSTESVDRMGDIIRVNGWQTKTYMKNPVFLWAHNSSAPPIGKCVELHIETSPKPALVQTIQFADAKTYDFADSIYRLYKNKFLNSVSVGFMPLERPKPIKDEDGVTTGFEFTSQELLELSGVPIPANHEAVARAIDSGVVTKADAARVFDDPVGRPVGVPPIGRHLPVDVARVVLASYANGKPVVKCGDEEAIQRAELICATTAVFKKIEDATALTTLLPKHLRDEFDAIIARLAPDEMEMFLEELIHPDRDTLESLLDSLAGS